MATALAACGSGEQSAPSPSTAPGAPLFIAHRGGGHDWPEMTLYAYQQAAQLPHLTAMEVSVHRAKDGTLVCWHDPDTGARGDRRLVIADSTWEQLRQVKVTAAATVDPSQPARPMARFDEVLAAWPKDKTMWVEPKAQDTVEPLFQALTRRSDLQIVWKRYINAPDFERAAMQGWKSFGYVLAGAKQLAYLNAVAPLQWVNYIGVEKSASDERVRTVVDTATLYGKTTVMWALDSLAERDRALRLGCGGLMCSDIKELLAAPLPK